MRTVCLAGRCSSIFNAIKTHGVIPKIMGGVERELSNEYVFMPGCWPSKETLVWELDNPSKLMKMSCLHNFLYI